jgi:hypothetical protein
METILNNGNFIYNGVEDENGGVGYFKNIGFDNIPSDRYIDMLMSYLSPDMTKSFRLICADKKNKYIEISDVEGKIEFKPVNIDYITEHFIEFTMESEHLRDLNEKDLKYYWNIKN